MKRVSLPVIAIVAAAILAAGRWLALDNTAHAQTGLLAPANVQVTHGDNPGEVVVSWDAVAGASGYRVGWVDLEAARAGTGKTSSSLLT